MGTGSDTVSRQEYETSADSYPEDPKTNRDCEVNSEQSVGGAIESRGAGVSPFVYSYSGRGNRTGSNQTYDVEVTADVPVRVYEVNQPDRAKLVSAELARLQGEQSETTVEYPDTAEEVESNSTKMSFTTRVKGNTTKNIVFMPATAEQESELPITVSMQLNCRYKLSYEEYKEIVEK
jgi:hypothetical protein